MKERTIFVKVEKGFRFLILAQVGFPFFVFVASLLTGIFLPFTLMNDGVQMSEKPTKT